MNYRKLVADFVTAGGQNDPSEVRAMFADTHDGDIAKAVFEDLWNQNPAAATHLDMFKVLQAVIRYRHSL